MIDNDKADLASRSASSLPEWFETLNYGVESRRKVVRSRPGPEVIKNVLNLIEHEFFPA